MTKLEDSTNNSIRVLTQGTCPSLSRKSKITFHVGADADDEIHVRVHANSGGGFFSREWISMKDIQAVLDEHPEGTPVTSFMLQPLFHGKSVNTPGFVLSILLNQGLLVPIKGKKRSHEPANNFTAMVEKMKSTSSSVKKKVTTKRPTKKAAIKKKAMARKKTV